MATGAQAINQEFQRKGGIVFPRRDREKPSVIMEKLGV
jgi:hypothetical protein